MQNFGVLEATLKGTLLIEDRLVNIGAVEAVGTGSSVVIDNGSAGAPPANADSNAGNIEAILGGEVIIEDSTIVNAGTVAGLVLAGAGSEILQRNATILEGLVSVEAGGLIESAAGTANRIDTSGGPTSGTVQPSIVNAGRILVDDNSALTLASRFGIFNAGTIELASTGNRTWLEFNQPSAILSGGGNLILDGGQSSAQGEEGDEGITPSQDIIDGLPGAGFATLGLENVDNTISGAGAIGQGDGALAFKNDARGTVDADLSRQTLVIATGANMIVNAGLFEATDGGTLRIESDFDNSGTVIALGGSEADVGSEVLIEADVTNESGGSIVARDGGARVEIDGAQGDRVSVDNSGEVDALGGGTVSLEFGDITNEAGGLIEAAGRHSQVDIAHSTVDNDGAIGARYGGAVTFDDDRVTNESDGLIDAAGRGSRVSFERSRIGNIGKISVDDRGEIVFDRSHIGNHHGGTIEADGHASEVRFDRDHIDNSGLIKAASSAEVDIDKSHVDNDRHGMIEADGRGSTVGFEDGYVHNFGKIEAQRQGEVDFTGSYVDNSRNSTIEADGSGSKIKFDHDHVDNDGIIGDSQGGRIYVEHSHVDDTGGLIEADGWNSTVEFEQSYVTGGKFTSETGALLQTVDGTSTFKDLTITSGTEVDVRWRLQTDADRNHR